jgi:hypothetical protein
VREQVRFQNTYRPCDLTAHAACPDAPSITVFRSSCNWFMHFCNFCRTELALLCNAIAWLAYRIAAPLLELSRRLRFSTLTHGDSAALTHALPFSLGQCRFVCRLKLLHCRNTPRSRRAPCPFSCVRGSQMCFAKLSHKFCPQLRPSFFQDLS